MKKALITIITTVLLIITIMLLCMCLISCTDDSNNSNVDDKRFAIVENGMLTNASSYTILYDKETLVMYVSYGNSYGYGLTVMLDKDGKPLLYDKEKEKE